MFRGIVVNGYYSSLVFNGSTCTPACKCARTYPVNVSKFSSHAENICNIVTDMFCYTTQTVALSKTDFYSLVTMLHIYGLIHGGFYFS